jgi:hypothetical protein
MIETRFQSLFIGANLPSAEIVDERLRAWGALPFLAGIDPQTGGTFPSKSSNLCMACQWRAAFIFLGELPTG